MALIVEDGSVVAGAESYISVADADTYHAKRANVAWDAVDDKEAALRKATDYLRQNYRMAWKGDFKSASQVLDWPRVGVYTLEFYSGAYAGSRYLVPDTVVPDDVKNACAELALKSATADLNPDQSRGIVSQTVGPISTTYDVNSPQQKRYRAIDMMLAPYLNGNSISMKVERS
jgi:hypothetical protein